MHPLLARTLRTASEKPVSSSQAEYPVGPKSKRPRHQFYTNEEARDRRAEQGSEGEAARARTHTLFWNELAHSGMNGSSVRLTEQQGKRRANPQAFARAGLRPVCRRVTLAAAPPAPGVPPTALAMP